MCACSPSTQQISQEGLAQFAPSYILGKGEHGSGLSSPPWTEDTTTEPTEFTSPKVWCEEASCDTPKLILIKMVQT